MKDADEPAAVTGIGLVTPLGTGVPACWEALTRGEVGVRRLEPGDSRLEAGADPSPLPDVGRAGFVRGFRPREAIRHPLLRRMDWCSRMLVAAAREAATDAGPGALAAERTDRAALVVGSELANQRETSRYLARVLRDGLAAGSPLLFPNLVLNAPAGYAAIELGITGPNLAVSEHEASGEAAIAAAVDLIASQACDVAVAGGVDEMSDVYLDALAERRVLEPRAAGERRRSRRGWLVPGEGAAALVLEPRSRARERGARVYAEVVAAWTGTVPTRAYRLPEAARAGRLVAERALAASGGPIDAVLGCGSALGPRSRFDRACLDSIEPLQGFRPGYAAFRDHTGEWGSAGALGVAIAALAIARGSWPLVGRDAAAPPSGAPSRVLVAGAARGGAVAGVVLARPAGA